MSEPRELTPGELTSLERIAILRGKCGRYRRAMRDAMDQLRPEEPAYQCLAAALDTP